MRKSREPSPFFAFSAYLAVSALSVPFSLLLSLTGRALAQLLPGMERVSRLRPVSSDAAVYAVVCALTALAQYYLVSLLSLCGLGRRALIAAAGCGAFFSGLFFWRAAAVSSLGSYVFSGLPVVLAALIGGASALSQAPEENPWPAGCAKFLSRFI